MSAPIDHLDTSPSETVRRHAATFRKVRQARLDAVSEQQASTPAKPEPVVAARDASCDEVPKPAKKLSDVALANGWAVRVVYARSASYVESVTVRCRRGEAWAIGCWRCPMPSPPMKLRWSWAWGVVGNSPRVVGARELTAWLSDEKPAVDSPPIDTVE